MKLQTLAFWGVIFAVFFLLARRRDAREKEGLTPSVEVTVRVPARLYRAAQQPPVYISIAALTGVSITFCPFFLFLLGGGSFGRLLDWRVIACLLVTYVVPMFYMMLARPVLRHALQHRRQQTEST